MAAYADWLKQYSVKFNVHAWVFMTNHVHLLRTPHSENGVSLMMQSLGRMYVRDFNSRYKRTGTLWEGRFKSALVQSDKYLLQVYRYIELNPVRANMVSDPAEYSWSSYRSNAPGRLTAMLIHHSVYSALGSCKEQILEGCKRLFNEVLPYALISYLREVTSAGLALGWENFITQIEQFTGERYRPTTRGRRNKKQNGAFD
jgi:putative transposase